MCVYVCVFVCVCVCVHFATDSVMLILIVTHVTHNVHKYLYVVMCAHVFIKELVVVVSGGGKGESKLGLNLTYIYSHKYFHNILQCCT